MDKNDIKLAFELSAKLKTIAIDLAEQYGKTANVGSFRSLDICDNFIEATYEKYIGCGEYEPNYHSFSINEIIEYAALHEGLYY